MAIARRACCAESSRRWPWRRLRRGRWRRRGPRRLRRLDGSPLKSLAQCPCGRPIRVSFLVLIGKWLELISTVSIFTSCAVGELEHKTREDFTRRGPIHMFNRWLMLPSITEALAHPPRRASVAFCQTTIATWEECSSVQEPFRMWYIYAEDSKRQSEEHERLLRLHRRAKNRKKCHTIMKAWRHFVSPS